MTSADTLSRPTLLRYSTWAIGSMNTVRRTHLGYRQSVGMMSVLRHCCIAASLLIAISCHHEAGFHAKNSNATIDSRVSNLHAFARLYGAVRWFHPSDAASAI